ncbi:uncharacterized protein LOC107424638 [Ziziphus jujuba]|uniref:Uncharacterized protein LOC107424638 n=2 Tax=Ziziphus jujuba TaxID=326968 RepID=A0A6P4A451_ZIZJJ|nr:uncharacterized protein LOC107424638 [Ziziphus jujuba]KAH7520008.1 hypothetical protein FEM48_Zijuj08G0098100 [Ziziphus jujuba var. spinosa]
MFRALSSRRSCCNHEGVADEPTVSLLDAKLKKTRSLTARIFGSSSSLSQELLPDGSQVKHKKKVNKSHSHPLLSLFLARGKKKMTTTASPEFARYIEYVKEGGLWNMDSTWPVTHYD